MASLYATNYTKRSVNVPADPIPPREVSGKVVIAYDKYSLADGATGDITSGDIIYTGIRIPKGARILDAGFNAPACGSAGKFKMGISGDDDGLVAEIDPGAAKVFKRADELSTLIGTVSTTADRNILWTCTETSVHNSVTSRYIEGWVMYSMP